jgi:hypothetical protein
VAKFEKGHPKYGGRKKGTRNKSSIMEKFEDINFDVIAAIIESIAAQPEYMRADTLIKMLEFVYPKKKSMDLNMVSDEELKQILVKKLQEKANQKD